MESFLKYLLSVILYGVLTGLNKGAFDNCTSLTSVTIGDGVTSIGYGAFSDCISLKTVYYMGTAEQWTKISIANDNSCLTNAARYYYSKTEPALNAAGTAYDGNYWHYIDGTPTVWLYIKES